MISWKQERDRLIEETRAFVLGVARRHPGRPTPAQPTAAPGVPEGSASEPNSLPDPAVAAPVSDARANTDETVPDNDPTHAPDTVGADVDDTGRAASAVSAVAGDDADLIAATDLQQAPHGLSPPFSVPPLSDDQPIVQSGSELPEHARSLTERTEIESRVAAFRAQQQRILADRQAYYEETTSRIRDALRNQTEDPAL